MNIDLIAKIKDSESFFENYNDGDNLKLYKGKSLLFYAMSNNDAESRYRIVTFLIDLGTDVLCLNEENETLLHVLFSRVKQNIAQTTDMCERLLQKGVDINQLDKKNRSAIQYVINMNFSDKELSVLYKVIFSKATVNVTTKNAWGVSPLEMAEKLPYRSELMKLLLEQ